MPTIFQKECLKNPSMTHRVIEHSRTLQHLQNIHYYLYSASLMVQLKMIKETIILRDIPTFHVGSPSCHGMSFTRVGPHDPKRPWRIGQWQTCKHWQKETNISRKASAKRVGRLSFFLDLFLGSNTCRSCSKALSPPTPFCLVMMFWPFLSGWLCCCTYQQSVVGSDFSNFLEWILGLG